MSNKNTVQAFWQAMDHQAWNRLVNFFSFSAVIIWPNTQEEFTVDEFIAVNKAYPGSWQIAVKQYLDITDQIITITKVSNHQDSYHAVSFFTFRDDKIVSLVEYWGQDGSPPSWRQKTTL